MTVTHTTTVTQRNGKTYTVELSVDLEKVARKMAERALLGAVRTTKKSAMGGAVQVNLR